MKNSFHVSYLMFNARGRRGLTLIELLVVVGIMTILTGVLIGYSKQSRNQILLTAEKAKVAQTIARAKSLTLAGYTKPASQTTPCSYGFGIDYQAQEYFIFQYNPAGCSNLTNLVTNTDPPFKIVESFALPAGVNFGQGQQAITNYFGHLLFVPPNLTTHLFKKDENNAIPNTSLTIYLETADKSLEKKILINSNGQLTL